MRRMQDIKEAELDNLRDLTNFLDAELEYHERAAEELRRVRQAWATGIPPASPVERPARPERRPTGRSRANTARSFNDYSPRKKVVEEPEPQEEPEPAPVRLPFRTHRSESRFSSTPEPSPRPSFGRSQTFQVAPAVDRRASALPSMPSISALRGHARPTSRFNRQNSQEDVFADDYDDSSPSGSGTPEWGERSASPATSMGSLTRSTSNLARKAPPPPPPCRSKKPPPPVPPKRPTEVSF